MKRTENNGFMDLSCLILDSILIYYPTENKSEQK